MFCRRSGAAFIQGMKAALCVIGKKFAALEKMLFTPATKVLKMTGKWSTINLYQRESKEWPAMDDKMKTRSKRLKILEDDPNLAAFEGDLNERLRH